MPAKSKQTSGRGRIRKLNRRGKKKAVKVSGKIPSGPSLLKQAVKHLWLHKKIFGLIFLVYAALYLLLVRGLAAESQFNVTKRLLDENFAGEIGKVETGTVLLESLFSTTGSTAGDAGGIYQLILFVLVSLAIIWVLRTTFEGNARPGLRDAFYKSTSQLVPYVLVGLVILLQSIPALVSVSLYSVIVANGIAVSAIEQIAWLMFAVLGAGISVYLISSSVFASYIVTLPDLTPLRALRSARKLVKFRRWSVVRKFLFLPFVALILALLVFFPLVIYLPSIAEYLFLVSSLSMLIVGHCYLYILYRELL